MITQIGEAKSFCCFRCGLNVVAYSFFWLSEGAYSLPRDGWCSKHSLHLTPLWILTLEPERRKNRQVAARHESSEEKSSHQSLKLLVALTVQRRNELLSSKRAK